MKTETTVTRKTENINDALIVSERKVFYYVQIDFLCHEVNTSMLLSTLVKEFDKILHAKCIDKNHLESNQLGRIRTTTRCNDIDGISHVFDTVSRICANFESRTSETTTENYFNTMKKS